MNEEKNEMEIASLQKKQKPVKMFNSLFPEKCNAHLDITLTVFSPLPKLKLCDGLNNLFLDSLHTKLSIAGKNLK